MKAPHGPEAERRLGPDLFDLVLVIEAVPTASVAGRSGWLGQALVCRHVGRISQLEAVAGANQDPLRGRRGLSISRRSTETRGMKRLWNSVALKLVSSKGYTEQATCTVLGLWTINYNYKVRKDSWCFCVCAWITIIFIPLLQLLPSKGENNLSFFFCPKSPHITSKAHQGPSHGWADCDGSRSSTVST